MQSSTPSSSDDAKSGISGGAIAGIVIGAIALVAAIVLSVFFLFRRRQQQMQQDASQHDPTAAQMGYAPSEPPHSSKGFGSPTVTANSHDPTVSANSDAGYQHQQWQQQQHQQQMSPHELHSPAPAAELANTYRQGELDGDWRGHELRG